MILLLFYSAFYLVPEILARYNPAICIHIFISAYREYSLDKGVDFPENKTSGAALAA